MSEELPRNRLAETPVAIVGVSALMPGARNVREFWQNIVDGRDCLEDVPERAWPAETYYDPDPAARDKTYCRRGGFVPAVPFDAVAMGVPPAVLPSTDIVQLLSLVVARDLLRDTGVDDTDWYDPARTGVVLGVSGALSLVVPLVSRLQAPVVAAAGRGVGLSRRDADELADRFSRSFVEWDEASFPGFLSNVVAGRVANRFNLGGLNCTVDAACASSLAAVNVAVRELVDGRADMMVTGGCAIDNTVLTYLAFSKTPALSASGRVRPFDEAADGTLLGDGIGMVALRRLADARRDNNRIYAVIRGIGAADDGRSGSIYAPQQHGQLRALTRAYVDADVSPASVGLFEAHGTGTRTGDAVELAALTEVLREATGKRAFAAIGSVKSQIGHTKAAAGAASLIKAALALHQKVLPPTINVSRPATQASGLYVNTLARPWITDPRRTPRRAAVSSFGFGGTNYHLVLEEHADGTPEVLAGTAKVAVWHAEDVATLTAEVAGAEPMDDAATIPAGAARIGVVYQSDDELAALRDTARRLLIEAPEATGWSHHAGVVGQRSAASAGKVAALFTGQGAQYVNMGRTALLHVPPVRQAFDALERANAKLAGIAFPPPGFTEDSGERHEELLRGTEYAQPAIGALSMGQYTWLRELGFAPDGVLGHSFGELTALWAAGALGNADFLSLAVARGRAMAPPAGSQAGFDPGAMAALKASRPAVEELLRSHPDLVVCHANAPDQFVVGGATPRIEAVVARAAAAGIIAVRLPVSAAFHTRFVAHAAEAFREAVAAVSLHSPELTVYANTPGAAYGTDDGANKDVLVDQLLHPVDFAGRITEMYAAGYRVFVEFGPKSILTQLVRRTLTDPDVVCLAADAGPRSSSDRALKLAALRLRVLGLPVTGINRYDRPAEKPPAGSGAEVPLIGVNYRPVAMAEAHRRALSAPYELTTELPTVAGTPPHEREEEGQAMGTDLPMGAGDLLNRQLALAAEYLDGQLRLSQEFMANLADNVDGLSAEHVKSSLTLASRYNSLIARSQAQSNAAIAELLSGGIVVGPAALGANPPAVNGNGHPAALAPPALPMPPPAEPPVNSVGPPRDRVETWVEPVAAPMESRAASGQTAARAALLAVVADKTGYPVETLQSSMDIEADLGIDSIKRVEIMGGLRDRFPAAAQVSAERLATLRTLDDVVGLLAESAPATPEIVRSQVVPEAIDQAVVPGKAFAAPAASLVIDDGSPLTAPVVAELKALGLRPQVITMRDEATLATAIAELVGVSGRLDLCVVLAAAAPATSSEALRRLIHAILAAKLAQPHLLASAGDGRSGFVVITQLDGVLGLHGPELPNGLLGGVGGLVKTLAIEAPTLFCRAIDVAPGLPDDTVRAIIGNELNDADPVPREVGHDGRQRWTPVVTDAPPYPRKRARTPDSTDLFVVTGGARGVTAGCVRALAARYGCELLILGRTPDTDEPGWAVDATGPQLKSAILEQLVAAGEQVRLPEVERRYRHLLAQREVRANLAALREAGARITYVPVDILDGEVVTSALAAHRHRVTGVIHGAGVLADRLIVAKNAVEVERVLATKLTGLENVLAGLDPERLDQLVVFSSVAGLFGNRGQADYAVANEALNRMVIALRAARPRARVTSINWGAWDGGMVTPELRDLFEHNGIPLIPASVGADRFVEQFAEHRSADTVILIAPAGAG